jgi:hypothetical protein
MIRFTSLSNNNRSKKEGILPTNHKRVKGCEEEEEECVGHGIRVLNWISLWLNWIQIQLRIHGMQIDVKKYKICSLFSSFVTMVLTKEKNWKNKKIEKPPFHSLRTNFKSKSILIEWNCIRVNNHALNQFWCNHCY